MRLSPPPALPRSWIAFAALGAALVGLNFLHPDPLSFVSIWHVYFGLLVAEIVRVEASGETVKREGVEILLAGFLILAGMLLLDSTAPLEVRQEDLEWARDRWLSGAELTTAI